MWRGRHPSAPPPSARLYWFGAEPAGRRLTIGCRGCGAVHDCSEPKALRAGPAPLTLGALGA